MPAAGTGTSAACSGRPGCGSRSRSTLQPTTTHTRSSTSEVNGRYDRSSPNRTEVTVRFELRPRPGAAGAAFRCGHDHRGRVDPPPRAERLARRRHRSGTSNVHSLRPCMTARNPSCRTSEEWAPGNPVMGAGFLCWTVLQGARPMQRPWREIGLSPPNRYRQAQSAVHRRRCRKRLRTGAPCQSTEGVR